MAWKLWKRRNIQVIEFPELDWSSGQRAISLRLLREYTIGEAQKAIEWYDQSRPSQKLYARLFRGLAIVLMGFAGLVPLFGKWTEADGKPGLDPILTGIFVGIAGILLLLDKFYGFSSAWVRYMKADQQLSQILKMFRFDYDETKMSWATAGPTTEQTEACLSLCKTVVMQVDAVVQRETEEWVTEFQNALKQIDAATKAVAPRKPAGAIAVTLTNGEQCTNGWKLTVDGGTEHSCNGTKYGLRGLTAGIHNVSVVGDITGNRKEATKPVDVKDGQISSVEFTL